MRFNLICVEEQTNRTYTFRHSLKSWWDVREIINSFMTTLAISRMAHDNLVLEEFPEQAKAVISSSEGTKLCTFYVSAVQIKPWNGTYKSHNWTRSQVPGDTSFPDGGTC